MSDQPVQQKPEPANALLQAGDVHKVYRLGKKEIPVLRGISLQVREGECLCIRGASGAGKSTLLHILGGLEAPTLGDVQFRGASVFTQSSTRRAALRARKVGFVFQAYHLLPELTVLENVQLPSMSSWEAMRRRGANRDRAADLLERVGLGHRLHHRPMELSGGEQQRAALARALMNEPELVLADEPTGNLDSKTGLQVLECLFELARGGGRTLVIVTHNDDLAARCDRTLLLEDGVLTF
jgi:predicted ABC-type transport system involved in lysophospholipase L1 biosynthesis ATPase subunit